MSTRAIYTFKDSEGCHHVYRHHDGYPEGACEAIANALPFAWPLPRFEADEFACAFIAGSKGSYTHQELAIHRKLEKLGNEIATEENAQEIINLRKALETTREYAKNYNGGGMRVMKSGTWKKVAPQDIEYRYVIAQGPLSTLHITAYEVECNWETNTWKETKIFEGTLNAMKVKFAEKESV